MRMLLRSIRTRSVRPGSLLGGIAVCAFLGILSTLSASPATAGEIHPTLQEELASIDLADPITVLFVMDEQADIPALNEALKIRSATRQERHRSVVETLQRTAEASQARFLAELESRRTRGEVLGYTPYWIANLVAVRATRAAVEDLAARTDIAVVESSPRPALITPPNGVPPLDQDKGLRGIGVTPGLRAVRAPEVWYELGITGEGALVGNMDTGVDGNHPALASRWRGNNGHPASECWLDVLGSSSYPWDSGSHGTHVMGTITGLGVATEDTIGVAWGAQWIAANSIGQGVGSEFDNDVINCFQWFADPDGNPFTVDDVPDVIQNSWRINEGFGGNYSDCDSRWWVAIDNCEAAGVVLTFSAGNEGPGSQTIGSPADRATTFYNAFSVGAVDATSYNWPYPIAGFSSRGPSGCPVSPELKIKPEIVAPGVDVYSSVPGGGYQQSYWSGTSMSGPHVAGVVGLMRSANPDIDVDAIKQILMDTARDEGAAGEDNTYGWGMIDAYEAVLLCLEGYGSIEGIVTNASNGGTPIPLAEVLLSEIDRGFATDETGHYSGMGPAGSYTVVAGHPSFAPMEVSGVVIEEGGSTIQNFALTDIGAPEISGVLYPQSVQDPEEPLAIRASITDYSALTATEVVWRVDGGTWSSAAMSDLGGDLFEGMVPGQPIGSLIEFYIRAQDVAANEGLDPEGAPAELYQIYVVQAFFTDDAETDQGWSLVSAGDATAGRWVRMDPYGTVWNNIQIEPADDHTPDPGVNCFVTGAGVPGGSAGFSDVDNGCVTLISPPIDLTAAEEAIVSYWRWFTLEGPQDGSFTVDVTSNGGVTWYPLETLSATANSWTQVTFNLTGLIEFTDQVRVRYIACDTGAESLVEAAIDDFAIEGIPLPPTSVEGSEAVSGPRLYANRPNPFSRQTELRFRLESAGAAELAVFDPSGRKVRTLASGPLGAGEHSAVWDGKDESGRSVAAGVYFYKLSTDDFETQRKLLLLR